MKDIKPRKECPRTLSGKHMWERQRRYSSHNESLTDVVRCIACGMIDDTKNE